MSEKELNHKICDIENMNYTFILNSCMSHCMDTRRRCKKSTAVLCTTQLIRDGRKLRPISLVSRARDIFTPEKKY